jgi:hypothetical protein
MNLPARLRLGGHNHMKMEDKKARLIELWMSNVTERAKRHGLTRDALYKSKQRNVPILDAITADVQEMQLLLAELGMEQRAPAELHAEIRVPIEDLHYLMDYWRRLISLDGRLDAVTTNVTLHFMSTFIRLALINNLQPEALANADEQGAYIHFSAKEKTYVIL